MHVCVEVLGMCGCLGVDLYMCRLMYVCGLHVVWFCLDFMAYQRFLVISCQILFLHIY